ncbi:hydroxypyruvate isomerase family protein [Paracoccus actinidiae]|jgi:hydroxypyruvate isomerase|uniref:hydroxypyruvate isomerase family protein n=1 Tax=Paracoccus actinidiae TaxID=3064531 RepID=UPI0027D2E0BE|nr:TIM barrel protein [Paracoccus sp. M09]
MKFSANLGFLWNGLPLPDAIRAASAAGFAAVECHWPYTIAAGETRDALHETGLSMLGLNTRRGDVTIGENGLSALPGREAEACAAIDEALDYARATGALAVHVMAGNSSGPRAREAFLANLDHACTEAAKDGIAILIEPLNPYNAPGYFLNSTGQAADIIRTLGAPNLRMMFDCYHVQIIEGDVVRRLTSLLDLVGHIQIAAVPDRGTPDHGELNYDYVLRAIHTLGWNRPVGAEYLPGGLTEESLGWMAAYTATNGETR